MPDPLSRLQAIMRLAYSMRADETAAIARDIYSQLEAAWVDEIRRELGALGIRRNVPLPRGEYADILRRESIQDARSIVNTFNTDLEREIRRLYEANPRGNRNYYISNIEQWRARRAVWKQRQIALMNDKKARHIAQQAFVEENLIGGVYRFDGPAPVCDDCAEKFAAGQVEQEYVDRNPTPLHPNCPHGWRLTGARLGVDLANVWVG